MSESRFNVGDIKPAHVALLKDVAEAAASHAVRETLIAMGHDPDKPFEAQKDQMWVRASRERCEGAVGKSILTAIGLLVIWTVATFWAGFKSLFPGAHP